MASIFLIFELHHYLQQRALSLSDEVDVISNGESGVGKDVIPKLLEKAKCHRFTDEALCDSGEATNCLWNINLKSCELCRKLTRKKQQYDEADACGMDDFVLQCDMYAPDARIFVREVKQDVYRDPKKTEREKDWKSKVRARSVTTHCAQSMDQEKSLCLVDRDVFVTPGTNDKAMFKIKFVCIYKSEMIGPARPWPMSNTVTKKVEKKKRTDEEKAALQKKIEKRRQLARDKAAAKKAMEEACAAKKTAEECSLGCFWNQNLQIGQRCKLCRGLSRKNAQYDEADVCLSDWFTLLCDDRGASARIFVREVLQDSYTGAITPEKKDYQSKYRARRITMFCASGENFDHNRCKFRRNQFAPGDVTPGVVFTIKYACFYANNLPKVPHIYINLNDTTPEELKLMKRLDSEQKEENVLKAERKKKRAAKKEANNAAKDDNKKTKRKPPLGWLDEFGRWTSNVFKGKKKKEKEKRQKEEKRKARLQERMDAMQNGTGNGTIGNETLTVLKGTTWNVTSANETLTTDASNSTIDVISNTTAAVVNTTDRSNLTQYVISNATMNTTISNATNITVVSNTTRLNETTTEANNGTVSNATIETTQEVNQMTEEAQNQTEAVETTKEVNQTSTQVNITTTEEVQNNQTETTAAIETTQEVNQTSNQVNMTTEEAQNNNQTETTAAVETTNQATTEEARNNQTETTAAEVETTHEHHQTLRQANGTHNGTTTKERNQMTTEEAGTTEEMQNNQTTSETVDKTTEETQSNQTTSEIVDRTTQEAQSNQTTSETVDRTTQEAQSNQMTSETIGATTEEVQATTQAADMTTREVQSTQTAETTNNAASEEDVAVHSKPLTDELKGTFYLLKSHR